MSTRRSRFQLYLEELLGCENSNNWEQCQSKLLQYSFEEEDSRIARELLKEDAADFYYKALLSLCKALNSIYRGYHSWPVVNLYYSCFYSIKSHLSAMGIGLVRCKGNHYLETSAPNHPIHVQKVRASGDHKSAFSVFRKFVETDILEDNTVGGVRVHDWLSEQRNCVQYRNRDFSEPSPEFFHNNLFDTNAFEAQVSAYISDDIPIYCFDQDHCMLAAPIKRLLETRSLLIKLQVSGPVSEKLEPVSKLLSEVSSNSSSKLYQLLEYQ